MGELPGKVNKELPQTIPLLTIWHLEGDNRGEPRGMPAMCRIQYSGFGFGDSILSSLSIRQTLLNPPWYMEKVQLSHVCDPLLTFTVLL